MARRRPRLAALALMLVATRSELEEGSICFNGCSGHGTCRDFMCTCEPGYHGDDCGHALAAGASFLPILSGGHFNVTGKNWTKALKKLPLVLVGFSSRSCHKCIAAETAYAAAAAELRRLKVPLLRADGDEPALRERLGELGLSTLPQVVAYRRGDAPRAYQGVHSEDGLVAFARKLKGPPVAALETLEDVVAFLGLADDAAAAARDAYAAEEGAAPNDEATDLGFRPATSAFVLGVFSDADGVEEDEYADFADVAAAQQHRHDVYFGAVTQLAISRALVDAKLVDRAPGVVLAKGRDALSSAVLDAMDEPLGGWVDARSLPAVGRLTALNFARYEKLLRPMLLLFLDLSGHASDDDGAPFVGGRSGGLFNNDLVEELRAAQKDESFRDRVAFAYIDGVAHADRMRGLGLFGGKEKLPALAFNTNERGVVAPFPEALPLERRAIREFCAAFLGRKLRSRADSDAFAVANVNNVVAPAFDAKRKPRRAAPAETVGVSEQFGAASAGVARRGFADHVVVLDARNFSSVADRPDRDVLVMFHEEGCAPCAHMAVYYKKLAERFHDMAVESLVVARFDVTREAPPLDGAVSAAELPTLVLLPAHDKRPPYKFYSGVAKVQPMMRWVGEAADVKFDLPDLCHLSEADRILYKEQVAERERARDRGEF